MSRAFNVFCQNIQEVKQIDAFYDDTLRFQPLLKESLDDVLRIEIVNVVSAMDNYFHQIVKEGIVEAYFNKRYRTDKWNSTTMALGNVVEFIEFEKQRAIDKMNQVEYETEISKLLNKYYSCILKTMSFQQPEKIADALSYIWINTHKIQDIVFEMNKKMHSINISDFNTNLKLIINQRNRIVHEADWDSINQKKYSINHQDVIETTNFICDLVKAVEAIDQRMLLVP